MNTLRLLSLALVAFSAGLLAQEAADYDGKWGGIFVGPNGVAFEVELVLHAAGGTWQVFAKGPQIKQNACLGRTHEVTLGQRSSGELKFSIDASKTLHGCTDQHAAVKLVDKQHLEGHFADGRALKLVRKWGAA